MPSRKPEPEPAGAPPVDLPKGVKLSEPQLVQPGGYEERSYDDALTDEHRAVLAEAQQLP